MADGGHAIGVRGESESERTPKGTAGKGAKESSYTPLYSAIPRLQKRSIKCCVPRICQLRVSRIEALAPLTDKSESNVRLVVDVSDGRSRFRETARTMKVRRAALSSQPVQITPMENVEWPVNQVFYLQYFHNLRKNSDNVRILLKKERIKRLGKNTVAECTVNLANVLQCPIEDGQVILYSKPNRRGQVNTPLVRMHCSLASLPMDQDDVRKWWPEEDEGDQMDSASAEALALLSMSEEEENSGKSSDHDDGDDGEEERASDEEWVERTEALLDHVDAAEDEAGEEMMSPDINVWMEETETDGAKRANLAKVFGITVLKGTKRFARMSLTPVDAIRNGYAKIRARRKKEEEREMSKLEDGLGDADFGGRGDLSEGDVSDDADDFADDGVDASLSRTRSRQEIISSQIAAILNAQEDSRHPASVLLLNDTSRRGARLRSWFERRRAQGGVEGPQDMCIYASTPSQMRAAFLWIVEDHYTKSENRLQGKRVATRVGLLGNDAFANMAVREYLALRSMKQKQWDVDPPMRFFIIPVGKRGRDIGLAQRLAQGDAEYSRLLGGDSWGAFFEGGEGDDNEGGHWDGGTGSEVEERIMEYMRGAHETVMVDIAEAFVTSTLDSDVPSNNGSITHQQSVPFVSSLCLRPLEPPTASPQDPMPLSIDFWTSVAGGEFIKTSSKGQHSEVSVRLSSDREWSAGGAEGSVVLQFATHKTFKVSSKRVRNALSLSSGAAGGSIVRGAINKLICTTLDSRSPHFTAMIDGVKLSKIRFVSVSPSISSSLIRTFPIAVFSTRRETEA